MGNSLVLESTYPSYMPRPFQAPTYDPQFGFDAPRKEKVKPLTLEEMMDLGIKPRKRDYCAHKLAKLIACHRSHYPFYILCKPEKHDLEHCQIKEEIDRMKEFEREKRLRIREQKLEGKLPL